MIHLVVIGAAGKMGGRIIANALQDSQIKLVGVVEASGNPALGQAAGGLKITDDLKGVLAKADVAIDFSTFTATLPNLQTAVALKKPLVIGTTGHTPDQKKEIEKGAAKPPVVFSPNMRVMVNVMWKILGVGAVALEN